MLVSTIDQGTLSHFKEYMPIPYGGLKFFAGLFNVLVLVAAVSVGMYFILMADAYLSEGARFSISVFGGGALLIGIPLYFVAGARGDWIRSYFARNVRGYIARFWIHQDSRNQHWRCIIVTGRCDEMWERMLCGIEIELRLGGWFSFGGTGIRCDGKPIDHTSCLQHWHVRLHGINCDIDRYIGAVHVQVRYTNPDIDGKDEQIVLPINEAIRLLVFVNQPLTCNGISNAFLSYKLMLEIRDSMIQMFTAQLEWLRQDHQESDSRRNILIDQLEAISRRIGETDRLKDTIEGLEIWIEILGALCLVYHARDQAAYDRVHDQQNEFRQRLDQRRIRRPARRTA